MSDYFARSPKPKKGVAAQCYADHVRGVCEKADRYVEELLDREYEVPYAEWLRNTTSMAKTFHDLGKLADQNQAVLSGRKKSARLPVRHEDAGAAHCRAQGHLAAAMLIYAHHQGLPDISNEATRGDTLLCRIDGAFSDTDSNLKTYLQRHKDAGLVEPLSTCCDFKPFVALHTPYRMALSCLVDADHSDAAAVGGGKGNIDDYPGLRPEERLTALDRYIEQLRKKSVENERTALRQQMYALCRNAVRDAPICYCDSPVGTGKTTAIMAYLLQLAIRHKLRRVFVVLPYTNIIDQSVEVYRKALTLDGESSECVVAAHHSRTDFQNDMLRGMTTTWRAPIVVTSAVQFFETMAAANPASLRKLHRLPGSAVFLDEAHAALPITLWPLAWRWLKEYSEILGCHFVLGSGSLYKFWEIEKIQDIDHDFHVPPLLPDAFARQLDAHEEKRISYHHYPEPFNLDTLTGWLDTLPGPRLCIINTVQSAAFIADAIRQKRGREHVEHLSTALTPKDRAAVLKKVRQRLDDPADSDWTLVATSCVEAGVNVSFRCGIRQIASLVSLLQTAGRINRNNEFASGQVWSIEFADILLNEHPAFKESRKILKQLIEEGKLSPEFCTGSLQEELGKSNIQLSWEPGYTHEYKHIADTFKVIQADTRIVVVDENIVAALRRHESIPWKQLQEHSVQIWASKIEQLRLSQVLRGAESDSLYAWDMEYDDFLGFMKGLLPVITMEKTGVAIL